MDELHAGDAELCAGGGDERLAAEGETALARLIMDSGDLPHAASHLGNAVAIDPRLPETHEALTELAARAGGPRAALGLFPLDHPFIGAVVCRAHLQAACGEWAEAVGLIAAAVRAEYDRPWSHVAWLTQDRLPEVLPPHVMTQALARAVGGALPDPVPERARDALRPFYDLTRAVVERHPGEAQLAAIGSGLARRFEDHDRAIAWARQARRVQPGHVSSVMLGYALRAAGRPDEALRVWEEEMARDDSDLSLMVDIAELYAVTGRAAQGLVWAERAAAAGPGHPQAAPAVHGVRHAADGDPAHLVALADHLRDHPDHPYASTVLARHSEWQPWLGVVDSATEATVNVLHQMLESPEAAAIRDGGATRLSASAVEPPSAALAFTLALPGGELANASAGDPDPRLPTRETAVRVWRYEGLAALPAVPPPSEDAARLLRDTASVSWPHLPAAYDHAVRLAGLGLADLLGVLVHPPLPPDDDQGRFLRDHRPELWVRAVQTFACLGIAHHRADQPWEGSERRAVLLDLLHGPEDWVNETAAFAMVATAWVDPAVRADVGLRLTERMLDGAKAYRTREVTVLGSLCRLVLLCPWLADTFTGLARDLLAAVAREEEPAPDGDAEPPDGDAQPPDGPPGPPDGPPEKAPPRRGLFRRRRD
jgi:tetratricopeptide (TPR) repeat protein